ncbi:ROK family protein [Streptomyces canarius]
MPASDVVEQPEQPWSRRRLRSTNERLLLDRLRALGASSRAQLARETGLSKPTVSSALASLAAAGLVHEVGTQAPERGRTAVLYAPDPAAGYALGVDIGRGWLRVAVVDLDGTVVARADIRNRARASAALTDLVVGTARQVIANSGVDPAEVVHGVVGTPGVYDERQRRVRYAMHLPGWGRAGLVDGIRTELGVPLEVHNDANLAALGEYTYGVGAGSRLFAYILIGTGLGMGVVSEGRLFTGARGLAGEIGFLPWHGRQKPERLEDAVSGVAVVESARRFGMHGQLTAKAVFDAARQGHPGAVRAVELEGERIAHTVAAAAAVLDPDLVVLGGGVGHSVDLLLRPG